MIEKISIILTRIIMIPIVFTLGGYHCVIGYLSKEKRKILSKENDIT